MTALKCSFNHRFSWDKSRRYDQSSRLVLRSRSRWAATGSPRPVRRRCIGEANTTLGLGTLLLLLWLFPGAMIALLSTLRILSSTLLLACRRRQQDRIRIRLIRRQRRWLVLLTRRTTRINRRVLIQKQLPRILLYLIAHVDGAAEDKETVDIALEGHPVIAVGFVGEAGRGVCVAPVDEGKVGDYVLDFESSFAHFGWNMALCGGSSPCWDWVIDGGIGGVPRW